MTIKTTIVSYVEGIQPSVLADASEGGNFVAAMCGTDGKLRVRMEMRMNGAGFACPGIGLVDFEIDLLELVAERLGGTVDRTHSSDFDPLVRVGVEAFWLEPITPYYAPVERVNGRIEVPA